MQRTWNFGFLHKLVWLGVFKCNNYGSKGTP
ncbi:Protein of unknown function [Pyronema omphalodes CBS 100304]|uniref:Uncharacterized protein n=1 Tax=Pyronema omphalodes (strain CBS 100304) TaxID=1076935 RepID=U4LNL0_PYROM|nr:Protein of unknown function [Pyronema omphalodes CBS 100304]